MMKPLTKLCIRCRKLKERYLFTRNRTTKDGLSRWCLACRQVATRRKPSAIPDFVTETK